MPPKAAKERNTAENDRLNLKNRPQITAKMSVLTNQIEQRIKNFRKHIFGYSRAATAARAALARPRPCKPGPQRRKKLSKKDTDDAGVFERTLEFVRGMLGRYGRYGRCFF